MADGKFSIKKPSESLVLDPLKGFDWQLPVDQSEPEPSVKDALVATAPAPPVGIDLQRPEYRRPQPVPVPEELQPWSTGKTFKELALSMIPVYGQARSSSIQGREELARSQYAMDVANAQKEAEFQRQIDQKEYEKGLEIQARQVEEEIKVQKNFGFLQMLYPNKAPHEIMAAARGLIKLPTTGKPVRLNAVGMLDGSTIPGTQYDTGDIAYRNPITQVASMGRLGVDPMLMGVEEGALPDAEKKRQALIAAGITPTREETMQGFGFAPSEGGQSDMTRYVAATKAAGSTKSDAELMTEWHMMVSRAAGDRGEERTARTEVAKSLVTLVDARRRYEAMLAAASDPAGWNDMVLLSNHIAMTFGDVKGARTGTQLIEAHLNARSLPDKMEMIAKRVLKGEQLTPEQRAGFLKAARDRVVEIQSSYDTMKTAWDYAPPGEANMLAKFPPLPQAEAAPIVQRNKKTGAVRHSLDGGKTWLNGPPAQQ